MEAAYNYILAEDLSLPGSDMPPNTGIVSEISSQSTIIQPQNKVTPTRNPSVSGTLTTTDYSVPQTRAALWREEQQLKIDTSRFMQPIKVTQLVQTEIPTLKIVLPSREINRSYSDWSSFVLLAALIIFTTVKLLFGGYLYGLFQGLVNYPTASRMFRERNLSIIQGAIWLNVFYFLVSAMFIYQAAENFRITMPADGIIMYFIIFGVITLFIFLKKMSYSIIGFLNETMNETREFLFNFDNYNKISGILIFPFIALTAYAPVHNKSWIIISGAIIIGLMYIMMLQRGALILLKKQFSFFYLFLYLCTLEILPLLVIFKIILS